MVTVRIEPPGWLEQGHTDKTNRGIERVVEWIEERETPFTTLQCWEGIGRFCHYNVTRRTIRSMVEAGLVVVVSGAPTHPVHLRYDLLKKGE